MGPRLPASVAVLGLALALAAACSPAADEATTDDADRTSVAGPETSSGLGDAIVTAADVTIDLVLDGPHLAVVVDDGGTCPDGPCRRILELSSDGRWHARRTTDGGTGWIEAQGTYDAAELMELARVVDGDAIVLGPFQGECPTAYDGFERSYRVLSPDDPGRVVLDVATCHQQLDASAPILVVLDLLITGTDT